MINQEEKDGSSKKKKKKVDYDSSSSSDEEPGDMSPLADSSGGEDFIDVEQPPLEGDVNVAELQKGDFVLVALKNDKNKKVYYVAQVETPKEGSSDCSVVYLKKSLKHRHGFVFPTAIQPYPVADEEIEMVITEDEGSESLASPLASPTTSISFERCNTPQTSKNETVVNLLTLATTILRKINEEKEVTDDEFSIAGKKYAFDLRALNTEQRTIAEKIVSDVIYYGKLAQLNVNSSINLNTPNYHQTSSTTYSSQLQEMSTYLNFHKENYNDWICSVIHCHLSHIIASTWVCYFICLCCETMSCKKRDRSINFSTTEKVMLINIIQKYKSIVENKKTDITTCDEKKKVWEKIQLEFNATAANCERSVDSIRRFYENQKKNVRKIAANEKKDTYLTGGGTPNVFKKEPFHDVLLSIMNSKSVVGLKNKFDGDGIYETVSDMPEKENVDPASSNVANTTSNIDVVVSFENGDDEDVEIIQLHYVCDEPNQNSWKKYKPTNLAEPISEQLRPTGVRCSDISSQGEINSNSSKISRRRPHIVKALTTSELSEKYNRLIDMRLEIAEFQKQLIKADIERRKEEHALKCALLKAQIENSK
ncbi:apontic [Holotrichia oblita]|uniref:Apontic n=1 Tax=Holotrichia oblita TaxID=644536 RepID=A0ACB9SKR2_HOLOL|nr:apontic [Holotrichia oblita]